MQIDSVRAEITLGSSIGSTTFTVQGPGPKGEGLESIGWYIGKKIEEYLERLSGHDTAVAKLRLVEGMQRAKTADPDPPVGSEVAVAAPVAAPEPVTTVVLEAPAAPEPPKHRRGKYGDT